MYLKRLIFPLIMTIPFLLTSCLDDVEVDDFESSITENPPKDEVEKVDNIIQPLSDDTIRSTKISSNGDGNLIIERSIRENPQSMGNSDTWSIFVYLCGTDLETEDGSASEDLEEMLNATVSNNYRFIVETGGTESWQNDYINSDSIQRFVIENGEINLIDELSDSSMGSSETLSDFLTWGVQEYSAESMGVILWNHGGGSIDGVCFDETEDSDSLSLEELDIALTSVYPYMTDKFEFIGFDACLMSTIEMANILVPHANYMIASQETESGYGWDYTAIGDYLAKNPNCDGAELGKEICNSFYQSSKESWESFDCTLACVDLSKIDNLINSLNSFYEDIFNSSSSDENTLANITRSINSVENFGGNNSQEGYTNMVDLGCMVEELSDYSNHSDEALSALDDCIVYSKTGFGKWGTTGLSIYYPLTFEYPQDLSIFKNICVSPYYMSFIDMLNYGNSNGGDISNYSSDVWFGEDSLFWNDQDTQDLDYWEYSNDCLVEFSQDVHTTNDGYYSFTISSDTLDYAESIYCNVLKVCDDGSIDDLGIDNYVDVDWSTGVVSDCFDGWWYFLGDGQPLAMYIIEESEDYDIYTSPVFINGEETNLRIMYDYTNDTITILGTWNGIDEYGQASRDTYQLQEGDTICPIYDYYYEDEDGYINYYDYYTGQDYIYTNTQNDILLDYLPTGDYYYCFQIYDIFGGYFETNYCTFTIDENGDILYYDY